MNEAPLFRRYWPLRSPAQVAGFGLFFLPALFLAACAPNLGPRPQPASLSDFAYKKSVATPNAQTAWPKADWWTAYHDAQLNGLIGEALNHSPDMKIAVARLDLARASARQTGASLWPTLSANGSVRPTRQSLNTGFPDSFKPLLPHGWHNEARTTADLDYQLDLFGKNRAALAAATSEAEAAQVDVAAARLTLSTAVADAYARLVQLGGDRRAAKDAVRLRQQSRDLVSARVKQGLENTGQLAQADARLDAAKANQDAVEGQIVLTRNQLAALLGKGPDRGRSIAVPQIPALKAFGVPASLDADLLSRRPDITAARLRAEAAAARIDVAHADFYPNIDLTGYFGLQSLNAANLLEKASIIGQIGPALHLPIFDGGRIEGAYRGARARYDEAVASYNKTLSDALHDVADAVANQRELEKELGHARASQTASEKAYRIARLRYRGGLSRYLDVLTAEDTLVQQRRAVTDLEARAFTQDIALVRALGGGFVFETAPKKL